MNNDKKIGHFYKEKTWFLSRQKNGQYYTMYPVDHRKGQRGTKRQWLGSEPTMAELRFKQFFCFGVGCGVQFTPLFIDKHLLLCYFLTFV